MQPTYQVIARKWRPKSFAELVGQEAIVQTLINAIQSNRIAHAYLFIGPKGTGKTSTARLFAQALNCEGGPKVDPDPNSPICQAILQGSCMDVIEIDGASNNSVDQIRDLREDCQYTPAQCKFKIYIIDEVHMLSTAAFNALLKTLEEPPAHVKFIFATTESQKILPTILSRCQIFQFKPLNLPTLVKKLELIAKAEGIHLEPEAARAIARLAKGGMRDAQSMLDQLIAFCGKGIEAKDVQSVYGLVSQELLESLLAALVVQDYANIIGFCTQLFKDGADLLRVFADLQETARSQLLTVLQRPEGEDSSQVDLMIRLLDSLKASEAQIKTGLSEEINFEIALLKASEQARSRSIDSLIKRLSTLNALPSFPSNPSTSQLLTPQPFTPLPASPPASAPQFSTPELESPPARAPQLEIPAATSPAGWIQEEEGFEAPAYPEEPSGLKHIPQGLSASPAHHPSLPNSPRLPSLEASIQSLPASTQAILEKDFKAHFVGLRR